LLNKELIEDAIKELSQAVVLNPEIAEAHYNLGIAYTKSGLTTEAIKAYGGFIEHAGENYRNYVEGVQKIVSQMKGEKNPVVEELQN